MPDTIEVTEQDRAEARKVKTSGCWITNDCSEKGLCEEHQQIAHAIARARHDAQQEANQHARRCLEVCDILKETQSELAECRADTARLDWLMKHRFILDRCPPYMLNITTWELGNNREFKTVRDAIDAAMGAMQPAIAASSESEEGRDDIG